MLQAVPIRIVLRRVLQEDKTQKLVQDSLTPGERQQLRDRYDAIEAGPPGGLLPFYKAFYHASKHHPGDPEPLIVLSNAQADEMTWEVYDLNGNPEDGFEVSVTPEDGGPPDPLNAFPKNAGTATVVHSGQHKGGIHGRHHYKFKVETKNNGPVFDPDWYAAD